MINFFLRESKLRIPSTRGGDGVDLLTRSRAIESFGERDRRISSFGCCCCRFFRRSIFRLRWSKYMFFVKSVVSDVNQYECWD
jgi:hypothetical protein